MGKEKKSDKEKSYTKKSDKKGANTLATATATSDVNKNTDMRDANTLATTSAPLPPLRREACCACYRVRDIAMYSRFSPS